MKKIFNYIMLFAVALSGLALTACSDDTLDTNQYNKSGVNILAFGPMPVTRGETMRLTGTNLNNVKEVLFPEGNQKLVASTTYINADFSRTSNEEMTVTIPDQCVPGKLSLVTNSGDTIVSASNVSFAEEIKVKSFTSNKVHPGDVVSIKGEYVWNIASVTFTAGVKVEAADFIKNTRNEVQLIVPIDAISGPVTCSDGAEGSEDMTLTNNLEVDAAVANSLSNTTPDFNQQITIYGENLDLVNKVDFPSVADVDFTPSNDGKSIVVTVPETATSGYIVLTSYSGLTTSIEVTLPLVTYTAGSINPAKNLKPGQTVMLAGDNFDRVVKIILPGDIILEKGQFKQVKTQLSFVVPENMGDGKVTLVQHDNWSVETDRISMYAEDGPVKILWKGNKALGWSGDGQIYLGDDGGQSLKDAGAKAGDKLRIALNPLSDGWCAQIWEGHWATMYDEIKAENYDLTAAGGYYTITLTDDLLKTFTTAQGWGGIVLVQGQEMTVTELALVQQSNEKTVWTGPKALAWSGDGQVGMISDGGAELLEAGMKVGSKIKIYFEPTADDWCVQVWEGHWSYQIEEIKPDNYDLAGNGNAYVVPVTADNIKTFTTSGGWGNVLLCQGQSMKVVKVTLIP